LKNFCRMLKKTWKKKKNKLVKNEIK